MNQSLENYLIHCQTRVNKSLGDKLQTNTSQFSESTVILQASETLVDAMRYSVLNGGKRIRPILLYAAGETINAAKPDSEPDFDTVNNDLAANLDTLACAIECIHAYSLIHDDLPAMDNDDLRRGKPTCHKAFDEATAILAGDALQAEAFHLIAQTSLADSSKLELISLLTQASGRDGMVGGQAIDLASVNKAINLDQLQTMHRLKTGALIRASVAMGAMAANATAAQLQALDSYAKNIGLAFQIQDDILDVESDLATLGKQPGADIANNKPTYPALMGMDAAKSSAQSLLDEALSALNGFGDAAVRLHQIGEYIVGRNH